MNVDCATREDQNMIKYHDKFIQLLQEVDYEKVFQYIAEKDAVDLTAIKESYSSVINEIMQIEECESAFPFYLSFVEANENSHKDYIDVSILNNKYVKPFPVSLRPWGGNNDEENDAPEGHYNVNWDGYHRTFGLGFGEWGKSIFGPVFVEDERVFALSNNPVKIVAEILYELTFHGLTQNAQALRLQELERRVADIKSGEEKGYTVEEVRKILGSESDL